MKNNIYGTPKATLIAVPLPLETKTYKPVSHERLIDLTLEGLHTAGLTLTKESYTSTNYGNVANASYEIGNIDDDEMSLCISWRNSYDKSMSLSFIIGALVKVCGNGMMKSQGLGFFKQKHWGAIQTLTPNTISEYLKGAGEMFQQLQMEREHMKEIELTRTTQAELIGRMFIEEQFIKSTQLNVVKHELQHPTHNYGDPNSLWSLYQYTTFAMREDHPSLMIQDHLDAHKFFSTQFSEEVTPLILPVKERSPYVQLSIFEDPSYVD